MIDKFMKIIGGVTLALAFSLLIYAGFLLFYPATILEIKSAVAVTPVVKAGGNLIYQISYCKYVDSPATVTRTFHEINERNVIPTENINTITKPGCHTVKIPIKINADPQVSLPGEYYLQVSMVYEVNAIRSETITFRVNDITIK